MSERLPLFPLNTVVFPGLSFPLHVFEERYRALVHHLLAKQPADRLLGTVAIREGYEVGSHGSRSLHRIGCLLQMTDAEQLDDGRFDIEVVARQRLHVDGVETDGSFLLADVTRIDEHEAERTPSGDAPPSGAGQAAADAGDSEDEEARTTLETFEAYRGQLSQMRGDEVLHGPLPKDPVYLSYSLAATCLLTLPQRQALLEAPGAVLRLRMLRTSLREEMRAMRAIPSLPATEVARTRWSPN